MNYTEEQLKEMIDYIFSRSDITLNNIGEIEIFSVTADVYTEFKKLFNISFFEVWDDLSPEKRKQLTESYK